MNNFKKIQDHIQNLAKGPIKLNNTEVYDLGDTEQLWLQLEDITTDLLTKATEQLAKEAVEDMPEEWEEGEEQEEFQEVDGFGEEGFEEMNEFGEEFGEQEDEEEGEDEDMRLITQDEEEQKNIEMALQMDQSDSESASEHEARQLTEYEKKKLELKQFIQNMEKDLVAKKSWRMAGEVTADEREAGSLLQELPEFELKIKPRLEMTEELGKQIEDLLKQRIKDKIFDNVEYKKREEKKQLAEVNTDKAKEGLGQLIKEQTGVRTEVSELVKQKRKQAIELMADLEAELRSYFVNGSYAK